MNDVVFRADLWCKVTFGFEHTRPFHLKKMRMMENNRNSLTGQLFLPISLHMLEISSTEVRGRVVVFDGVTFVG